MNAAYTARRAPECRGCRLPLPVLIVRPDEVSANWKIGMPRECPHGCDTLIAEIAAVFWPLYDLHDPVSVPVADSHGSLK
jgi:hypothetical protein